MLTKLKFKTIYFIVFLLFVLVVVIVKITVDSATNIENNISEETTKRTVTDKFAMNMSENNYIIGNPSNKDYITIQTNEHRHILILKEKSNSLELVSISLKRNPFVVISDEYEKAMQTIDSFFAKNKFIKSSSFNNKVFDYTKEDTVIHGQYESEKDMCVLFSRHENESTLGCVSREEYQKEYEAQLPFLEALSHDSVIRIREIIGDSALGSVGFYNTGGGALGLFSKKDGKWSLIDLVQASPSCDLLIENDYSTELIDYCYIDKTNVPLEFNGYLSFYNDQENSCDYPYVYRDREVYLCGVVR